MSGMDWQAKGACVNDPDPELWFSTDRRDIAEAKSICKRECWVQTECAEWALANKPEGVWAGMTAEERKSINDRRGAA